MVPVAAFEQRFQSACVVCLGQCVDPAGGGVEEHSVALLGCGDSEGCGEVGFSGSGWAE